jgi:hypothetical protein
MPSLQHEPPPLEQVCCSNAYRQAIMDARKEGYLSAAELNRLTRQLNRHAHSGAAKERATA